MGGNYSCQVCNAEFPASRARVHCRICPNYDPCADCHVTESVAGTHCVQHDYEIHIHDRIVVVKDSSGSTSKAPAHTEATSRTVEDAHSTAQTILGTTSTAPEARSYSEVLTSEAYWGQLPTPSKAPSPIFFRLTAEIFRHFDAASASGLQPSELCALMFACGFSPEDFLPLQVSTNESASPGDLHELDAWLANWYRSFPLDHRMATREFPPPPPVEPVDGRIRMRDEFLHALTYPQAPVVPNGLPLLSRLGLERYFMYLLLNDPANFSTRLNQLLSALPRLMDLETNRPFESQLIPRACFPLIPDPEEQDKKRIVERLQYEPHKRMLEDKMQAERDALMAISTGMR